MDLLQGTVGKKIIMAATGLVMLFFVLAHMLGNSNFLFGAQAINSYAAHLQELGPFLWIERVIIFLAFCIHIFLGLNLTLENFKSKSHKYIQRKYLRATFASRNMIYSGLLLLAFVVYHLLHFTFHLLNPEFSNLTDQAGRFNVYAMGMQSFQNIFTVLVYLAAMSVLCLHLWHGIGSFFQTLGWNDNRALPWIDNTSRILALVLLIGFISVPLSLFIRSLG